MGAMFVTVKFVEHFAEIAKRHVQAGGSLEGFVGGIDCTSECTWYEYMIGVAIWKLYRRCRDGRFRKHKLPGMFSIRKVGVAGGSGGIRLPISLEIGNLHFRPFLGTRNRRRSKRLEKVT